MVGLNRPTDVSIRMFCQVCLCVCVYLCPSVWKGHPPTPPCHWGRVTLTKSLHRAKSDVTQVLFLLSSRSLHSFPSSAQAPLPPYTHTPLPVSPECLSAALSFRRITRQRAQCVWLTQTRGALASNGQL